MDDGRRRRSVLSQPATEPRAATYNVIQYDTH